MLFAWVIAGLSVNMTNLELFIGALVVVYVVPGPDMVLVLQTSSMQGRWHAVAAALQQAATARRTCRRSDWAISRG